MAEGGSEELSNLVLCLVTEEIRSIKSVGTLPYA